MDPKELISKLAFDRDGKELGQIIRIDKLPHILHKRIVPHLMILKQMKRKKEVLIPVDISEITAVKGDKVHLKILEKYFLEEANRQLILQSERSRPKNFLSITSNWFEAGNVDRRPKNRRD